MESNGTFLACNSLKDDKDLKFLLKGSQLLKVKSSSWRKERFYKLQEDCKTIWQESKKMLRSPESQISFFASKVEHESKHCNGKGIQRPGSSAFDRVYTANQNCGHAYPTFLAVLWCAGLLCSQAPAAFAGLMYLFVRQKYFVGYLGERTQSTPGYLFGKRIILFLFLMSVAGILNYYLIYFFGSDFEMHIKTITSAISPLLLIP